MRSWLSSSDIAGVIPASILGPHEDRPFHRPRAGGDPVPAGARGRRPARARAAGATGEGAPQPTGLELVVGFVTNFFDTLGIGSFAPTTAIFKLRRLVRDEWIPGTLNVGHTLPTIAQAFIFIAIVNVDVWTLTLMIAAAVAGSWLGAGVVAGWPRRNIQIGMGCALLVAATLFLLQILGIAPGGGDALALTGHEARDRPGGQLRARRADDARRRPLRALPDPGRLLGMNPQAAFPIMMGSCAFLMPVGSLKFIRSERYSLRARSGSASAASPPC